MINLYHKHFHAIKLRAKIIESRLGTKFWDMFYDELYLVTETSIKIEMMIDDVDMV